MKLNKNFISHNSGNTAVLIPVGSESDFSGIVKGNKTLGMILDLLKEETTEETIVKKLKTRFNDDGGRIESDVKMLIAELRKIGAIDE